jgi:cbb3-type cytochrome oxidase subunit 3
MSGGGKAGLAIGLLLLIGALLGLAFFIYRRRKSQTNEEYAKADDEKSAYAGGLARSQSSVSTKTTATAPRLSLRPVTEFHPELASRAAAAGGAAGGAAAGAAVARNQQNDPANPFGNHAAVQPSQKDLDEKVGLPIQTNAENPFADNTGGLAPINGTVPLADTPAPLRIRTPSPETTAAAGAGAAAAGVGALAGAKMAERSNAPKPLKLTPNRPITPAGHSPAVSEFSQTPMSPGAMANGPPPSNVHRIQLDFKPSMDDELGLRAGQLVRLLHEYDDGWVSTCLFVPITDLRLT